MKTRTAIVREIPSDYQVVELDLEPAGAGELTVEMVAAGLCHTDDHLATGDMPMATMPFAGGHEGAGVVVDVGIGVKGFAEGDHVVFSFLPACGHCRWCASGRQNLCDLGANLLLGSRFDDPTSFRLHLNGQPVGQMAGLSTFSDFTTVDVNSAVRVPKHLPLETLCLLGCGVGTGWGSAVNSAGVTVGDTVIVMGVGGIGINAVQGAAHAGATHVIAVDPVGFKRELAEKLGATESFADIEAAGEFARSVTNGQGSDSTIVTVGVTTTEHVAKAFATIRKAGTCVVTGIGHYAEMAANIPLMDLVLSQKRIQGSLYGECNPSHDIPLQLELYEAGKLKLDELITARYTLDQVAQGYRDLRDGKILRGVIAFQ
jgi:NDMA-dependent alcohol dehydrogenase